MIKVVPVVDQGGMPMFASIHPLRRLFAVWEGVYHGERGTLEELRTLATGGAVSWEKDWVHIYETHEFVRLVEFKARPGTVICEVVHQDGGRQCARVPGYPPETLFEVMEGKHQGMRGGKHGLAALVGGRLEWDPARVVIYETGDVVFTADQFGGVGYYEREED